MFSWWSAACLHWTKSDSEQANAQERCHTCNLKFLYKLYRSSCPTYVYEYILLYIYVIYIYNVFFVVRFPFKNLSLNALRPKAQPPKATCSCTDSQRDAPPLLEEVQSFPAGADGAIIAVSDADGIPGTSHLSSMYIFPACLC